MESCCAMWRPDDALVAPGPRVTKQMPGRPVSLPIGFRHDAGAAFLPADRHLEGTIHHGVERSDVAFAGYAEDMARAMDDELIDQHLGGGSRSIIGAHSDKLLGGRFLGGRLLGSGSGFVAPPL